jgi:Sap, sulfolipid-1-addressing protein
MNAEFFALAFLAALNPKLLAIDLLLMENRRPRAMFLCVLLGGLTVGITVGLLDVLVFHLDAISSQKTVSAGVDLALGLLLLAVGALVATGRLRGRRKAAVPATGGQSGDEEKKKMASRAYWPSPGWGWPCSSVPYAASQAPATSPGCTS